MDNLKRKKKPIEGYWGESAKDLPTIKSNFFLELKYSEWMSSRMYLRLMRLGHFYREFGVGQLVRCH